jgi:molybdate transport system ATP-binding protein
VELREATLLARGKRLFPRTSWAIHPGEHWAIVGPNGSGKSALALALRGEIPLAGGEVDSLAAEAIAHVSFDDQRQLVARWSHYLQGRYESNGIDGAPPARALLGRLGPRRRSLLDRLGLRGLLDRKLPLLSNGEARKLLIAQALLAEPRLLILEEPLLGLDRVSRAELRRIIREAARLGVTILLVATRSEDVIAPVRKVLCLRRGRIVARGTRRELLAGRLPGAVVDGRLAGARRPRLPVRPRLPARLAPSAGEPIVEMRGVTVEDGGQRLLDGVDWTIRAGENWALVGPNGSGKTTLLSLILADNPQAYANDVRFLGRRRGDGVTIWEIKAACGHVSPELQIQDAGGASVLEVILSGFLDSVGLPGSPSARQVRIARSWARSLGVTRLLGRVFPSLSEGERRLVLIARALVKRPRLLVLDEPCQGLDDAHRARVLDIVERVGSAGRSSIIYVTHEPGELPSCVNRVLRLDRGRSVRIWPRLTRGSQRA